MFTSDPTRYLDAETESPKHRRPKGCIPVGLTAVGLGMVCVSLTVSASRLAYQSPGPTAEVSVPDTDDDLAEARPPNRQTTTERATGILHAITGPGEMSGLKIDKPVRSRIIETLKRAGLSHAQAAAVIDTGTLPASLSTQIQALGKEAHGLKGGFGSSLSTAFVAALRELDSDKKVGKPSKPRGSVHVDAQGKQEASDVIVVEPGDDSTSSVETSQGTPGERRIDVVTPPADDFDYGDALGDLVGALNPFQSWSRSAFRVQCTMTRSVSEATGEVKVTVTTETKIGVTVTTEITKGIDEKAPTLVTQVTDTHTGEVLSDPITSKAPSVETVSSVAFGQLAQGIWEATTDPKEQPAKATAEPMAHSEEPAVQDRQSTVPETSSPAPQETSPATEAPIPPSPDPISSETEQQWALTLAS